MYSIDSTSLGNPNSYGLTLQNVLNKLKILQ